MALLACVIAPDDVDLSGAFSALPAGPAALEPIARAHRVHPLLASCHPADARLASLARASAGRGRFLLGEALRIAAALSSASVAAIALKGPIFALRHWGAPGRRHINDLDFLVAADDRVRAADTLRALGFIPQVSNRAVANPLFELATPELALVRPADGLIVELHWRIGPAWFPAAYTFQDLAAHAAECEIEGVRLRWPAPEELLLAHLGDGLKSCGCGMKWIGDAVRLLRQGHALDWRRVAATAQRRDGLSGVRVALAVAEDVCEALAEHLRLPALRLGPSSGRETLAREARAAPRLREACRQIRDRLQADSERLDAVTHFSWALRLSDGPWRTARAIGRYLAGPAMAEFSDLPLQGASSAALRLRALQRRCRLLLGKTA